MLTSVDKGDSVDDGSVVDDIIKSSGDSTFNCFCSTPSCFSSVCEVFVSATTTTTLTITITITILLVTVAIIITIHHPMRITLLTYHQI